MSRVRRNILANYTGTVVSALLSILFVPLYIRFLGVESYGLLGIFATLTAIFAPLDAGLSATTARSLARMNAEPESAGDMRTLVRSLEVLYWGTAVAIGLAIMALAPFIATRWLHGSTLPVSTIRNAILTMGAAAAMRWPMTLYAGGLGGLQQQVTGNAIIIVSAALGGLGGVAVLALVSPTMTAFMLWQLVIFAGQTFACAFFLYRRLPAGEARFDADVVRATWRSASGLGLIAVIAVVITQTDKIVLSKLLPLKIFGYYTIAGVITAHLYRLGMPVSQALFPRFTELMAKGDEATLRSTYHRGAQLVSGLVFPVAFILALFSHEILLLWTQRADVADHSSLTLSLLVAGTAAHMLMLLPWQLQLAAGWLRLTLIVTSIEAVLLTAGVIVLGSRYGGPGAAAAWLIANLFYVTTTTFFMHRRLLRGEERTWYLTDVGRPLLAAAAVSIVARLLVPRALPQSLQVVAIGAALAVTAAATAMITPAIRTAVAVRLRAHTA